jgi:hydroxymethylglutaryl-CoA lyase
MRPAAVTIVEVGPRDGLQNEAATLTIADKIEFINRLTDSGLPAIEAGAFVSPKWVPQMADSDKVFAAIDRRGETRFAALVPNLTGLERAHAAGVREIALFAAASEAFSRKNINQTIDESLATYRTVATRALALGMRVRAYVSTAFGCPYEGVVPVSRVATVSEALIAMGAYEVAISDTIGIAHPGQVPAVVEAVSAEVPKNKIALHFHDTRGMALANVLTALDLGIATFDASAGGLGGCPYAPGATGNLATEDLVYMLEGLGIRTGVNLDRVVEASAFIEARIGHDLPSRYYRAVRATTSTSD